MAKNKSNPLMGKVTPILTGVLCSVIATVIVAKLKNIPALGKFLA